MGSLFSIFDKYPNLLIALSEKRDGSMKLSNHSRDRIIVKNRRRFLNKLGFNPNSVISTNLVQGNVVKTVTKKDAGDTIAKTDGLLTCDKDIFLSITVADCPPIFLYDYEKEIVGLIHGGWRGLAQEILSSAIEKFTNDFNSQTQNILAGIGPGISQHHYEVGEDVLALFESFPSAILKREKKTFLNLKKIAKIQLLNLGLKEENIEINPECTHCLVNKYFSYRRDKPKALKTMMALIGMK